MICTVAVTVIRGAENMPGEARMAQEEKEREARVQQLEREIADLKARWPKHSVPPAMLMRLEELEEELEQLKEKN
jgi:polyhydroxyalkanoate synthesis regulator phasin